MRLVTVVTAIGEGAGQRQDDPTFPVAPLSGKKDADRVEPLLIATYGAHIGRH